MTFYGKSRVERATRATFHESPASMTVPLMVLAVGQRRWPAGSACPSCGALPGCIPGLRALARAGLRSGHAAAHEAAEGAHHDTTIEWVLMGLSVGVALGGILHRPRTSTSRGPADPELAHRRSPSTPALLNKWYVDEIYDFLFVQRHGKGGGEAHGPLRLNDRGRRRQRRGLDDPLRLHRLDLVGHLDRRRRGALSASFTVEAALLPGAHSADRAACRPTRWSSCWASLAIFGYYWSALSVWTSTYSASILFTPLAGLLVLLLHPRHAEEPHPRAGRTSSPSPGSWFRCRWSSTSTRRTDGYPVRRDAPTGSPRSACSTSSASTASACCWSCSPR